MLLTAVVSSVTFPSYLMPNRKILSFPDPKQFRTTILWLEDQKIRHYKIEDRAGLRKFDSEEEWDAAYEVFKKDVGVPESLKSRIEEMAWLLSYATRLEYYDNCECLQLPWGIVINSLSF